MLAIRYSLRWFSFRLGDAMMSPVSVMTMYWYPGCWRISFNPAALPSTIIDVLNPLARSALGPNTVTLLIPVAG